MVSSGIGNESGREALNQQVESRLKAWLITRQLSEREAEVALYAGTSLTCGEIGRRCYLEESTVQTYFKRIYPKLQILTRQELAALVAAARVRIELDKSEDGPA